MTDWLRQMVGLSPQFTGVIQGFASEATLVALLCARERSTDFGQTRGGLQAEEKPLVVYASEESHSSVWKAARLAGFGKENLPFAGGWQRSHNRMRGNSIKACSLERSATEKARSAVGR